MARKKSIEELQARTAKLQEQLKQAKAEERKAKQLEEAKRKKEEREKEMQEALKLIDISKRLNINVTNENGERESISIYERLRKEL